MKKTATYTVMAVLVAIVLVGCGHRAGQIEMGADNYGKAVLDNGITILVNYDETTSLTAARVQIGGGVLTETAENNGITNLMTNMLLKGNTEMSASEITERLDFLGANVSVDCSRDYSYISFVCLSENLEEVFDIIARSITSPTFPEAELTKLKLQVEGNIKAEGDNQAQACSKLFFATMYGNEGYGLPALGTVESIENIHIEDIKEHYRALIGGNNIIFSIATNLSPQRIPALVDNRLGGIEPDIDSKIEPSLKLQENKEGFISFERNQSFIYMGFALPHLSLKEAAYITLLNEVMGNNVGSRLWYLRQKEKLAYAVYTQYAFDKYGAMFRAAIGTDTSKVAQALSSLDREWNLLAEKGLAEQELVDAKVNMKNNLIYRIDRKSSRAASMATSEWSGYNYRFVLELIDAADAITLDEINEFAKNKLTVENRYVSIVGKK
ncbi:MAG: pitrilysin family protein [Candidatus Zixiibacteriota bacterium]